MHTNIEIIRKYRKLLRKKKRLNSLLFSYLHCDSKLVELYKNAYITTIGNNKGAREGMARVDPQMSPREVEMVHVYPFRRVIKEAGLLGVMSSYNDYDGFPIQSSSYWLTTRLRGEWGFRGYVVSDSDAVEYLYTKHGTAKDMKEA